MIFTVKNKHFSYLDTDSILILVVEAGVGVEGTSESVLPVRPNLTLAPPGSTNL